MLKRREFESDMRSQIKSVSNRQGVNKNTSNDVLTQGLFSDNVSAPLDTLNDSEHEEVLESVQA